jgi:thymidylate kinase
VNPIILEGPDAAGKTTLAKELELCGFKYIHNGPPAPGDPGYADQLREADGKLIVFDRFHIGEIIYGPLLRGKSLVSDEEWEKLDIEIERMGGVIVICLPTWRQVLDGWAARENIEHIQKYDQLRESYTQYRRLIESHDNYLHYDYNQFSAESFAEALTCLKRPFMHMAGPRP